MLISLIDVLVGVLNDFIAVSCVYKQHIDIFDSYLVKLIVLEEDETH